MSMNQSNLPLNLDMASAIGALDGLGSVAKSCRFIVVIKPYAGVSARLPNSSDFHLVCDAAEFPGRGFNVMEARYYGPTRVFPNNTLYNPANFSFICRTQSKERQFFDEWMDYINPVGNFNFKYAKDYYSDISIYQLAEYSSAGTNTNQKPQYVYSWSLRYAWPMLLTPQQVTWADQDILRLQVTFTYRYWDRPNIINTNSGT